MFKKFIILMLLGLCCSYGAAQMTTVSATSITDSDGTVWANGSVTVSFYPNPNTPNPGSYKLCSNGASLSASVLNQGPISLDGTGSFSISVYDNGKLCPVGSQWQFTVCPLASSKCGTLVIPISGTSVDITSIIDSSIPVPRFPATSGNYGYSDLEAQLTLPIGGTYWNTTNSCQRYYAGTWQCGTLPPGVTCTGSGAAQVCTFPGTINASTVAATTANVSGTGTFGTVAATTVLPCVLNGDEYVAGSSCYATITAAVTAAIANGGCLYIPSTYAGTEAYAGSSGYLCGEDHRHGLFGFYHYMTPSYPITGYPMGNDAVYGSLGPADTYVGPNIPGLGNLAFTTSSTAMSSAVNATITVANMCTLNGTNAFSPNAGLLISQGASDYEAVSSFTLTDCTHINFTPAVNHSSGFGIMQDSVLHLRNNITFQAITPPGPALGYTLPTAILDGRNADYLLLPGSTTDAFPHNTIRANTTNSGMPALFTGYHGVATGQPTNDNLILTINSDSSHCTYMNASTGSHVLSICDGGVGFSALTNVVPVAGGGTGSATAPSYSVFGNATGSTAAPGFTNSPAISGLDIESPGVGALTIGNNGGTGQGNVIAGGSTSGNYRGLCIDDNATASNCSAGSQASTSLSSWRVDQGGGSLNWPGTNDTYTIGRVAAGGTFTTPTVLFQITASGGINGISARKGTFICTAAGTITISNTNMLATSDVTITMNTAGGTITTPPAFKTVTGGTGFSVLCGASDTSTYNYHIWN